MKCADNAFATTDANLAVEDGLGASQAGSQGPSPLPAYDAYSVDADAGPSSYSHEAEGISDYGLEGDGYSGSQGAGRNISAGLAPQVRW